jgi:antitoxin HicB
MGRCSSKSGPHAAGQLKHFISPPAEAAIMIYKYSYETICDDNGSLLIAFPDVPEAITFAENPDMIHKRAADALSTALEGYSAANRGFPTPSDVGSRAFISLELD